MAEPGNSQPEPVREKQKIPDMDPDEREDEQTGSDTPLHGPVAGALADTMSPGLRVQDTVEDPVEILVGLAERGEIDPWNINIIEVTDRFLSELERRRQLNLQLSGRTLFYAATLLRMKSEQLEVPGESSDEGEGDEFGDEFGPGIEEEIDFGGRLVRHDLVAEMNGQGATAARAAAGPGLPSGRRPARDSAEPPLAMRVFAGNVVIDGPPGKYLLDEEGAAVYFVDPGINGVHKSRPDGSQVSKFDAPKANQMLDGFALLVRQDGHRLMTWPGLAWADTTVDMLQAELIKGLLDSRRLTGGVARPGEIRAQGTLMSNIRHFELVDDGPGDRHIRLEVSAMLTRNRDARQVAGENFLVIRPVGSSDAAAMLEAYEAAITDLVQQMIGWTLGEAQAQKEKLEAVGVS